MTQLVFATRGALSFALLWWLFLLCSSGTRSSLPGGRDVQNANSIDACVCAGNQLLPRRVRSHAAGLDFDGPARGMFGTLSVLASTPWPQFDLLSLTNADRGVFGVNWGVRPCANPAYPVCRALATRRPHAGRSGRPKRSDGGPRRPRPRMLRTSESAGRPIGTGRR